MNASASASASASVGNSSGSITAGVSSSSSSGATENRESLQVMETILQQSSLANELRQVYHGLIGE
jgi:hypothetical protein